ncbi:MAG: glycoside hydrolase family 127 protein [Christensenellales bacterium]|jgi:DUF1680 family protein
MKTTPISMQNVHLTEGFWADRQRLSREASLWGIYDRFAETGRFDAIDCTYKEGDAIKPHIFWDSDVAKWIESAAYLLMEQRDEKIERTIDDIARRYKAQQWEDGYINSYFTPVEPHNRFTRYTDHELYCLGHLLEAAVAYAQATGKEDFLHTLLKYVDLVDRVFRVERYAGFDTPGHEEIELALYKVYLYTGDEKYLELMRYFVDARGTGKKDKTYDVFGTNKYSQAHLPVREQKTAEGHSVRAMYLYCAMADLVYQDDDEELCKACEELFFNTVHRRMYVTGGIGSSHVGEAFTFDYDLMNRTAYAETCASIGLALFARRMGYIEPKGEYADIAELALYNGMLSGISLDGVSYFYENPLEAHPKLFRQNQTYTKARDHMPDIRRKRVFDCSCCPPNLLRVIASMGDFAMSHTNGRLYVHQYFSSTADTPFGKIEEETKYPYDGEIRFTLSGAGKYALCLRIPKWSKTYRISVNGETVAPQMEDGYAVIERDWQAGDTVALSLDMRVRLIYANPNVHENCGRVAVQKGPVVYCAEEADNGENLKDIAIFRDGFFETGFDETLGVPTISCDGARTQWEDGVLYSDEAPASVPVKVKLIPFFAWANREEGEMLVWLRVR